MVTPQRIERLLIDYIGCPSIVNTESEKCAEDFIMRTLGEIEYFRKNDSHFGKHPIPGDALGRSVCWGLIKRGRTNATVVLMHHFDVVGVEDFKRLEKLAFSPFELTPALLRLADTLPEAAKADLLSGDYLFGRGSCDMKAGGAIQLALMEHYACAADFDGNILLLAVPDEENLSAGMRAGVTLLARLKDEFSLDYRLMLNSEPHQQSAAAPGCGIFSTGSAGKLMPFIYARGFLSHAGKAFEGFNPLGLLAHIVRLTEMNSELSERVAGQTTPPPTWLCLRDGKTAYDVSIPLSAYGCLSVLTMRLGADVVMRRVRGICERAFDEFIAGLNASHDGFAPGAGALPWRPRVMYFSELYADACDKPGFARAYRELLERLPLAGQTMIDATREAIEFVYGYTDDLAPTVVIGLSPPYYPGVTSGETELVRRLSAFTQNAFGQRYVTEHYFTGISDLSYSSAQTLADAVAENMPIYGQGYSIPAEDIRRISMPCVNIGPWGKDFHRLTERVYKADVYERTPAIIEEAIDMALRGV